MGVLIQMGYKMEFLQNMDIIQLLGLYNIVFIFCFIFWIFFLKQKTFVAIIYIHVVKYVHYNISHLI